MTCPRNLFDEIALPSGDVGIRREGDDYWFYLPMVGDRYWAVRWFSLQNGVNRLGETHEAIPGSSVNQEPAGVFTGGPWTLRGDLRVFQDDYRFATSPASATWTSPPATFVGMRGVAATNFGIGKVAIDGSPTAANLLPTAQDEVNAGNMPATALVANGGTLNPTDRVVNQYTSGIDYDRTFLFADALALGAHTVQIDWTPYTHPDASSNRVGVSGWVSGPATGASVEFVSTTRLTFPNSAWEYAIHYVPDGGTTSEWTGANHENETQTSVQVSVGGTPTAIPDNTTVFASDIQVVRTGTFTHPEATGATADVTYVLNLTDQGMNVQTQIDWLQSGDSVIAYGAMLPADARINRFCLEESTDSLTLDLDDDIFYGTSRSLDVIGWEEDGNFAVGAQVTLDTVNAWQDSTPIYETFVQDRIGFNKIYFSRIGESTPITAGEQWNLDVNYRAAYFNDPEATLGAACSEVCEPRRRRYCLYL